MPPVRCSMTSRPFWAISSAACLVGRLRIEAGDAAWTDGERIVLPPLIAALPDLDDNFQLAKITVALLWAQTRFGSLRIDHASVAAGLCRPRTRPQPRFTPLETLRSDPRASRAGCQDCTARCCACVLQLDPALPPGWARFETALAAPEATHDDSLALLSAAYDEADCPQWSDQGCLRPDAIAAARAARLEKEKARLRVKLAELLEEHQAKHS
ncbi:MAG: hypothetical protein MZW92_35585 [Comamonadaceae bacterium]|nr:hypothetical protein [Comamonadaceae bacterium]